MGVMTKITIPIILPHWAQDLILTTPRIVCGYLLSVGFGSPKFRLPWSNPDYSLGLFEVAI